MLRIAVLCFWLVIFQPSEAEYYQDEPMGHFMEYSVEMPPSASKPTMSMRYGNIDKHESKYVRDFETPRPRYHSDYAVPSMPPFPFALPYQYIDDRHTPASRPPQQWTDPPRHRQEYPSHENSWEKPFTPRNNRYHHGSYYSPQEPQYDGQDQYRIPMRFASTVDEIQNRIFSMMQNIGSFPTGYPRHQNRVGSGEHRSGYSRESQYGYQMFI